MFKNLFGKRKDQQSIYDPHLPEVDVLANIEEIFAKARKAAAGEGEQPPAAKGRHVIIITPGRMLMFHPCPASGSMPREQVAAIEQMISPAVKRNIVAIACTELEGLTKNISKLIPFLGMLMGFAYIGHNVWIFEGHESALAAGCRDADVVIVDGGMIPHLTKNWETIVLGVMRTPGIYVHDRENYALRKLR